MTAKASLAGTTSSSFQIGKQGPTIEQDTGLSLLFNALDSASAAAGGSITLEAGNNTGVGSGGDISLTPGDGATTGAILLNPAGSSAGETAELRFLELPINGAGHVGFKAPDSIPSNITWVLPDADGQDGDRLTTDGAGVLSWSSSSIFEAYETTSTTITGIATAIPFNVVRIANPDFSLGPTGVITVNRAGTYTIQYTVTADSTNSARDNVLCQVYINGVAYPGSLAYLYNRTNIWEGSCARKVIAQLSASDTVEIRVDLEAGSGCVTFPSGSGVVLERKSP